MFGRGLSASVPAGCWTERVADRSVRPCDPDLAPVVAAHHASRVPSPCVIPVPYDTGGAGQAQCLCLSASFVPFFIVRFCRFSSILPLPRFHPKSTLLISAFCPILPQFCRWCPVSTPFLPSFCRHAAVCLPHAPFCRCSAVLIENFCHFSAALLPLRRVRRFSFFGMRKSAPTPRTRAAAALGNLPGTPPTPHASGTAGCSG